MRSLGLVALVVLFAAIAAPTVLKASTNESLEKNLQPSQEANASDNSNLKLEQVDFSTRGAIVRNLPPRIRRRPAAALSLAAREHQPGARPARHGGGLPHPLLPDQGRPPQPRRRSWPGPGRWSTSASSCSIAYSLSAGNAGTAFRYRTQIVAIFICIVVDSLEIRRKLARSRARARRRRSRPRCRHPREHERLVPARSGRRSCWRRRARRETPTGAWATCARAGRGPWERVLRSGWPSARSSATRPATSPSGWPSTASRGSSASTSTTT